ncbi:MAG TPA: Fic family protein [Xanthobacteraceae bacterium]|nr:Fic family protein [Xanthobacteraceae bacterium]
MASLHEKLAESLEALHKLQADGRRVFRSDEFSRVDRERLLDQGFLREVIKGWVISTSPHAAPGDTTPWYASLWEFCARYCEFRFGKGWHLSPEQSLQLHAEDTVIPKQVVVYSPKGTNNTIESIFHTSLYDLKSKMPSDRDLMTKNGLRLFKPAATLVRISEDFMRRHPSEVLVVLAGIRDASEVLSPLLEGGHTVIAGRLAGAFARTGRPNIADEIVKAMKAAGHDVRPSDPFAEQQRLPSLPAGTPPIVGRLQSLWSAHRDAVMAVFPAALGLPNDTEAYLKFVDEIYKSDAYHSLSIEGYRVTPALIDRVRTGTWNPQANEADRKNRDALAARGYWQAFQKVKDAIAKIIASADAAPLVREAHREWYREMFEPCVAAGLIKATALAGYRNHFVYLKGSRHVPPRWEILPEAMDAYFDLLEGEKEPSVRIVLGHWLFGYIHPYPDGNGRMARFLMNAMLASGGYPWTIIRVEDRDAYMKALESASADGNLAPFAKFIGDRVKLSIEQRAKAIDKKSLA